MNKKSYFRVQRVKLLTIRVNLPNNHCNYLVHYTQPCNHGYFVVACLWRYPLPL